MTNSDSVHLCTVAVKIYAREAWDSWNNDLLLPIVTKSRIFFVGGSMTTYYVDDVLEIVLLLYQVTYLFTPFSARQRV